MTMVNHNKHFFYGKRFVLHVVPSHSATSSQCFNQITPVDIDRD